jgi:hypothetical protein
MFKDEHGIITNQLQGRILWVPLRFRRNQRLLIDAEVLSATSAISGYEGRTHDVDGSPITANR